ncbi:MAG: DUF4382 domain-containing protein [Microscillaceae bacterium]|jgi:hypothetical protein|nr:DUF4382 domain-containing protein [Microscillaceae bacterium]
MKINFLSYIFLILSSLGWLACNQDPKAARLEIRMTDAPGDYSEVNIDIQEIRINVSDSPNDENGWIKLQNTRTGVYNILKLTNGLDTLLADIDLPAGKVSQIRLILGKNNTIRLKGQNTRKPLDTPSAMQSGLKIQVNATLQEGINYRILLDFDASRSIVETGSGKFKLKPVIRAITEAIDGGIKGKINPVAANPAVYVIANRDTIAGTIADASTGHFLIKNLPAGTYKVAFAPVAGFENKIINQVVVNNGGIKDLGTIKIED